VGPEQVPKEYVAPVLEGVRSSAQSGGLKGYPVVGVKVVAALGADSWLASSTTCCYGHPPSGTPGNPSNLFKL